jgi:hypothetical protein
MKSVKAAMYAQTIYMFGMGLGILLAPQLQLPMFGFVAPTEIWVRVLGALILGFGFVNFQMARQGVVPYFWASIIGRTIFCSIISILGILQMVEPSIFLLVAGEMIFTIWAFWGLKKMKN